MPCGTLSPAKQTRRIWPIQLNTDASLLLKTDHADGDRRFLRPSLLIGILIGSRETRHHVHTDSGITGTDRVLQSKVNG